MKRDMHSPRSLNKRFEALPPTLYETHGQSMRNSPPGGVSLPATPLTASSSTFIASLSPATPRSRHVFRTISSHASTTLSYPSTYMAAFLPSSTICSLWCFHRYWRTSMEHLARVFQAIALGGANPCIENILPRRLPCLWACS